MASPIENVSNISIVERLLALRSIPAFGEFPDRELAVLAGQAKLVAYDVGATIIAMERPVDRIVVPVRGSLEVRRGGEVQSEAAALNAGLGMLSVLSERPSNIEVTASAPAVVMEIHRRALSDALEDDFQMSARLLRRLSLDMAGELHAQALERLIPDPPVPLGIGDGELDLVERLLVLRPSRVFKAASLDGVAQFAKLLAPVAYPSGELLWRERDPATGLLVIVEGTVACTHAADPAVVSRYGPTSLLGAIDVLSGDKRWATARSETAVRGLWADSEVMLDVLEDNFELTVNLLRFIADRTLELRAIRLATAPSAKR